MFQSFETTAEPQFGAERVAKLREKLAALEIDGFLVPRADEFQGEYVPASAERLAWLTGFTGSAGVALIMQTQAIVFVDGRYTTQLKEQVDGPPHKWLAAHVPDGFRLGVDPWLHTSAEVAKLQQALAPRGGSVLFLRANPLDEIWDNRPAEPMGKVTIQYDNEAGELATEKIKKIAEQLPGFAAEAVVLTDPSSVAWVFNIRGADVPHTPHPLARAAPRFSSTRRRPASSSAPILRRWRRNCRRPISSRGWNGSPAKALRSCSIPILRRISCTD